MNLGAWGREAHRIPTWCLWAAAAVCSVVGAVLIVWALTLVLVGPSKAWDEDTYKAVEARLTASWALLAATGHPALASQLGNLLRHANECVNLGDEPTASRDERLALIDRWYEPYTQAWARMLTEFQQLLGEESLAAGGADGWNPRASKYHRPPAS